MTLAFTLGVTGVQFVPDKPALFLIVGGTGSGKSAALKRLAMEFQFSVHNVNLEFGHRLLETDPRTRTQAAQLFDRWLDDVGDRTVGLDNTDLLFQASLKIRPLDLLRNVTRSRCIVATWLGTWSGTALSHATPRHPEHVRITTELPPLIDLDSGGGRE